jgi:hypothetical protein
VGGLQKISILGVLFHFGGLNYNDGVELFDPPTSCNNGNINSKDLPPIEK